MIALKSVDVFLFISMKSELHLSLKSRTVHMMSCGICPCEATEGVILKLYIQGYLRSKTNGEIDSLK